MKKAGNFVTLVYINCAFILTGFEIWQHSGQSDANNGVY